MRQHSYSVTTCFPFLLCCLLSLSSHARELSVLHWWTSTSEQNAAQQLIEGLQAQDIIWQDVGIEGGAGQGAVKVLSSLILSGNTPDAAQIIGHSIQYWANLGFLSSLNSTAHQQDWFSHLPSTLIDHIHVNDHYVAAPIAIHRINQLYYNLVLFNKYQLSPPTTYEQLVHNAQVLQKNGVIALAHSSQPWQVLTLFEILLAMSPHTELYPKLLHELDLPLLYHDDFRLALIRLRELQQFMDSQYHQRPWQQSSVLLAKGDAGMMLMGDWAKAELASMATLGQDFDCMVAPDTQGKHLYSVDSFSFFTDVPTANAAASLMLNADFQLAFSQAKGTIPARFDINILSFDHCAQQSKEDFTQGVQYPSLTHRMANSEKVRDAFLAEIHRYFINPQVSSNEVIERLQRSLTSLKLAK